MISWKWVCAGLGLLLLALQAMLWTGQGSIAEVVALKRQIATFAGGNEQLRERNPRREAAVAELKNGLASVEVKDNTREIEIRGGCTELAQR